MAFPTAEPRGHRDNGVYLVSPGTVWRRESLNDKPLLCKPF